MLFCDRAAVSEVLRGKSVALVGSGPGSLENPAGLVDSHEVVCRINNYRIFPATGFRTDVFYSFFGQSIRKSAQELKRDGVRLCMAKCPDAKFMESAWHAKMKKMNGVDFRGIYVSRKEWWFCQTYVPTLAEFMRGFNLLGGHVATTGFSALLDILSHEPLRVYMTGFDFFKSGMHNVTDRWRKDNHDDPIGHVPQVELQWFKDNYKNFPITMDPKLSGMV